MKKFWKAMGIAALAALVPVRVKKDEKTGKKTFQSLLWKVDVAPGENGEGTEIGLDLMEGVLTAPLMNAIAAKKEAELFTDDPDEAVPFAGNEPEAAAPAQTQDAPAADAEPSDESAEEEATEEDFDPEA